MITVLDYGSGNVESVFNAMRRVTNRAVRASDVKSLQASEAVVVPGVGSFPAFMHALGRLGLVEPLQRVIADAMPCLGICVGMQALGEWGLEHQTTRGLGVATGTVARLSSLGVNSSRVPHVGWNGLRLSADLPADSPLCVLSDRDVYFMHSYAFAADTPSAVAWTDYEIEFCSAIQSGSALGIQFHPEKSQQAGVDFLDAWVRSVGKP